MVKKLISITVDEEVYDFLQKTERGFNVSAWVNDKLRTDLMNKPFSSEEERKKKADEEARAKQESQDKFLNEMIMPRVSEEALAFMFQSVTPERPKVFKEGDSERTLNRGGLQRLDLGFNPDSVRMYFNYSFHPFPELSQSEWSLFVKHCRELQKRKDEEAD